MGVELFKEKFVNKQFGHWNISIIWKGFLDSLHWIGKGLIWQVGKGTEIRVGADPIVGLGCSYILPNDLRAYLEDYGISTLDQAKNMGTGKWFSAEELDLGDEWINLWNTYLRGLDYNRISLNVENDTLLWTYGKYVGPPSAARAYDSILHDHVEDEHARVCSLLWAMKLPLKIICFT